MFEKHLWKSDILSKNAGPPDAGFHVSGTLVENGLIEYLEWTTLCQVIK